MTMYRLCCVLLFFCSGCEAAAAAAETIALQPYRRQIEITGFTRAFEERTLAAEVSGRYASVDVDVGDTVAADGKVAEIETTFVELDLAANRIAREKARRSLALEEKKLARLQRLITQESTTEASYDEAALAVEIVRLTLAELENEETRLQERLKRHTIIAPSGWRVIERFVDAGEYATASEPVVTVADYRRVRIPYALTFEELQLLQDISQLAVYLSDLDQHLPVAIHAVAPGFVAATRKIEVELVNAGPRTDLRGGLRAELVLAGRVEEHVFEVPAVSLLSRFDAHWLMKENGQRLQVTLLGRRNNGETAVIAAEGLAATDRFLADTGAGTNFPVDQRETE